MFYDWLYVMYSSDYSFLNIVSAKLLSMIYICWIWGKVGFCEMFSKRGNFKRVDRRF